MSTTYLNEASSAGLTLATATGSTSKTQHQHSVKGSVAVTTRIITTTTAAHRHHDHHDLENHIRALKTQLEQKNAAIVERDLKVQQQQAIIEALVQTMSEMEDELNGHSDEFTGVFGDTLLQLQEENGRLAKRVDWLESQLVNTKQESRMLKNVLRGKISGWEEHARNQDVSVESGHQASAKKLNAALQLAESENEDLTKQIQLLQSNLAESNRVASVWSTKCVELQRELGRAGKSEFVFKDSTQKTAKQRPSRAIAA